MLKVTTSSCGRQMDLIMKIDHSSYLTCSFVTCWRKKDDHLIKTKDVIYLKHGTSTYWHLLAYLPDVGQRWLRVRNIYNWLYPAKETFHDKNYYFILTPYIYNHQQVQSPLYGSTSHLSFYVVYLTFYFNYIFIL